MPYPEGFDAFKRHRPSNYSGWDKGKSNAKVQLDLDKEAQEEMYPYEVSKEVREFIISMRHRCTKGKLAEILGVHPSVVAAILKEIVY